MNQSIFKTYSEFRYIYPPRAEVKIPPALLSQYEQQGQFWAQPKYDGSCSLLFVEPGGNWKLYNRHNEQLTLMDKTIEFAALNPFPDRHLVLAGEYLNKSKKGENGLVLNHAFVIWDLLVVDNTYLIDTTFEQRVGYLEEMYGNSKSAVTTRQFTMFDHLHITGIDKVYRAPIYTGAFEMVYNRLVKTELYEGLVLKRINAPLTNGSSSANNSHWQLKCRRQHKNYKF